MELLQATVSYVISTVVISLTVGFIGWLARQGMKRLEEYLKTKKSKDELLHLRELADMVVKSLEQSPAYRNFSNEQKKQFAINTLTSLAKGFGIVLPYEMADMMIEAAVQEVKAIIKELEFFNNPDDTYPA